jgi:chromosome segregation ATPase
VGLFDETSDTSSNRYGQRAGTSRETLFDWLVKKAEADLGVAQALAAEETQRVNQIKRLETTLIGEIGKLQHQILESREADLNDLKSEIWACTDRVTRIEDGRTVGDATKEFVREELTLLREQLGGRQADLESRYSKFTSLGETLGAQIRALDEQIADKLGVIDIAQRNIHDLKSQAQSLTERVVHSESASWQSRTLAMRTAEQLEQSTEALRDEVAAVNAVLADFNDAQTNHRLVDTALKELAQAITHIQGRLEEQHDTHVEYDTRLTDLDSALSMLAERTEKTEAIWRETNAKAQAETNSASDFRRDTAKELAALRANISETLGHETTLRDLETALRTRSEEWQQQAAQKFMLLEGHLVNQAKTIQELSTAIDAKLADQDTRTEETLRLMRRGHEESLRHNAEVQKLTQHVIDAESAAQSAQLRADVSVTQIGRLETAVNTDIAAVHAELAKLANQQHTLCLPEERIREIEHKLRVKVDELQEELAAEREGFDHWGNGLRESFGSELSAIQARLSDRQSQLEHRYARLERWEKDVNTSIERLQLDLGEHATSQEHGHEEWRKLKSEFATVIERTTALESRANQTDNRAALISRHSEDSVSVLRREISDVAALLDQRSGPSDDSIVSALEKHLSARLREIEEGLASRFSLCDTRHSEHVRQAEETVTELKSELALLKTLLNNKQNNETSAQSPAAADSLRAEIRVLDEKLAERFRHIDIRDAEHVGDLRESIRKLQSEIVTIKSVDDERSTMVAESSIRTLEETLGNRVQDLQHQIAREVVRLENRDAERTSQLNQTINDLTGEVASLKAELSQQRIAHVPLYPALRNLEEQLNTKIQDLRLETMQQLSAFGERDKEIKELKERSQSLSQRVTHLIAAVQVAEKTVSVAVKPVLVRPAESIPAASAENTEDMNPAEAKARSEKEQLIKLQERMSSEIERVRAELKERSGRWKVRKSAS